jgi:hypothetical protein
MMVMGEWEFDHDPGPLGTIGFKVEAAAQRLGPFDHGGYAHAGRIPGPQPPAVILDGHVQQWRWSLLEFQNKMAAIGVGMVDRVGQRFQGNALGRLLVSGRQLP